MSKFRYSGERGASPLITVAIILLAVTIAGTGFAVWRDNKNIPNSTATTGSENTPATSVFSGGENSIAYIGCSNSGQAVDGYHLVEGNKNRFWNSYRTGGKSVETWSQPNHEAWSLFDQEVQKNGQPKVVWIQLCEHEMRAVEYSAIQDIITNLKQHTTTTNFYISSINNFEPKTLCERLGPDATDDTIAFADKIAQEGLAKRGPDIGPLSEATTKPDHCHANDEGLLVLGKDLVEFFDKL